MNDLNTLSNEVTRLERELKDAKSRLTTAKIESSGIRVGDVFRRTKYNGKMEMGQVIRFGARFGARFDAPLPVMRLFKADGTLGIRETSLYSWGKWVKHS